MKFIIFVSLFIILGCQSGKELKSGQVEEKLPPIKSIHIIKEPAEWSEFKIVKFTSFPEFSKGTIEISAVDQDGKSYSIPLKTAISLIFMNDNNIAEAMWELHKGTAPLTLDSSKKYIFEIKTRTKKCSLDKLKALTTSVIETESYIWKIWLDGKVILKDWDPLLVSTRK